MKLYLGTFHYFATGEGCHVVIATFLCEDHEDPKWIFYRKHCQEWSLKAQGEDPNYEHLRSSWEYYRHVIEVYLLEESKETVKGFATTTHDLPEKAILELQRHLGKRLTETIKDLAKYGLQKFAYSLHYNLS